MAKTTKKTATTIADRKMLAQLRRLPAEVREAFYSLVDRLTRPHLSTGQRAALTRRRRAAAAQAVQTKRSAGKGGDRAQAK